MVNITKNDQVLYDSLTDKEKDDLKQKCIDDILGNDFEIFCPLSCLEILFCIKKDRWNDSLCNEAVIKLMEKLIDKSETYKLFYGDNKDEDIQKNYELIIKNDDSKIDTMNVLLSGQVFIRVVSYNQKLMLPVKINDELLDSYVNYNPEKESKIVKRIPFIVNERNRTFLKLLQKLFKEIENNNESNKMTKSDLLHIFGPIVFKGILDNKQVHGFHRMVILEDVLNLDFDTIESEIYKD